MNAPVAEFQTVLAEPTVEKPEAESASPVVGLIMGSDSDWKTMRQAAETLESLKIPFKKQVVSAHRTPDRLFEYATAAVGQFSLIIAGAGGAAHLPGMTASKTIVPVIGVPVETTPLNGFDALLSIMQMPAEVGVATVSVGSRGATNAALFAAAIFARNDPTLYSALRKKRGDILEAAIPPGPLPSRPNHRKVVILVEGESDLKIMRHAKETLDKLGIESESTVISPTTDTEGLIDQIRAAESDGAATFIAGSERGIVLGSEVARVTMLPVLGVPIVSGPIESIDSFLRPFLDMPSGVATFAVGRAGAINAALFAATVLSPRESRIRDTLLKMREEQVNRVLAMKI